MFAASIERIKAVAHRMLKYRTRTENGLAVFDDMTFPRTITPI